MTTEAVRLGSAVQDTRAALATLASGAEGQQLERRLAGLIRSCTTAAETALADAARVRGRVLGGGSVGCVAFSPDERRILACVHDLLGVWDAETGQVLRTLEGHADAVKDCAWSPDGRRILSASWDKTLRVWDAETGQVLRILEGHAGAVWDCAWSPDGRRILSESGDKTLRVWDAETGQVLRTLEGHADAVKDCAWSPDGRRILSASGDKTLRVWDAEAVLPDQAMAIPWPTAWFSTVDSTPATSRRSCWSPGPPRPR